MNNYNDSIHSGFSSSRTLRTNFDSERLPLYKKAIEEFEKTEPKGLIISDEAYDIYGSRLSSSMSLHDSTGRDLSKFWRIFDRLRDEKPIL